MKRVLIISPHFPPINAPDLQRVRMALPHLRAEGWEPTVLAVTPESVEGGVLEPALESTYPADIRIRRVPGLPPGTRRRGGAGLWWRCGPALARAGDELLANEAFDVALFSTTQFGAFTLGPRWRRRLGLRYVLDYQDPWYTDYYARAGARPPGGRLRFALSQLHARWQEPRVLRSASAVIAVSAAYGPMLHRFYPTFDASRVTVLPFGVEPRDLALALAHPPAEPLIPFGDGLHHHVSTGRGGDDMVRALRLLFQAFAQFRAVDPERAARHRFHFIGTSYAPAGRGRETVRPLAAAIGVADVVHERPARVPYLESLWYLQKADTVLAVGSDDARYSASKVFAYLLAGRPALFISHTASPALTLAGGCGAGCRIGFGDQPEDQLVRQIQSQWFEHEGWRTAPVAAPAALEPWTAAALTRRLGGILDGALAR